MSPLRARWRVLAPLLALISVLAAGLVSAAPASAATVTAATSPAATCSSSVAAGVVAWEPENRVKGFLPAGPPRTGSSTSVSPNSVRGFDLFLRFSASGVTVYVNGDPVNLVDPNGHKACGDDGGANETCYYRGHWLEPNTSSVVGNGCYGPHAKALGCDPAPSSATSPALSADQMHHMIASFLTKQQNQLNDAAQLCGMVALDPLVVAPPFCSGPPDPSMLLGPGAALIKHDTIDMFAAAHQAAAECRAVGDARYCEALQRGLLIAQQNNSMQLQLLMLLAVVPGGDAAAETGPLAGTTYAPRVVGQMATGNAARDFPTLIETQATWGDAATVQGDDGAWYLHVNVPDGNGGFYQFVVDQNGQITHRLYTSSSTLKTSGQ